jgi:O-antigen/teichoic acid export membrane protein
MVGLISVTLDKVIVAAMCTPEQFAIYANGAMEIPLVGVITGSITAVMLPDIRRLRMEGRNAEALDLWKRGSAKSAMIILPAMCFLFCMAPDVMTVLFSSKYAASALPFRLYLLILPIRVVTYGTMFMAAGKNKIILYRTMIDLLLNLGLSIVFVHVFGYIGAAVAGVVMIYLWHVPFNIFMIGRQYGTNVAHVMPYQRLMAIGGLSALACVACLPSLFMPECSPLLRLAAVVPLFGIAIVFLLRTAGLLHLGTFFPASKRERGAR